MQNKGLVIQLIRAGYEVLPEKKKQTPYDNVIKGWREVGGKKYYFKSKWEINFSYYSEWMKSQSNIIDWWYEPEEFWFEGIKRGVCSYKPDFKWLEIDRTYTYYEIKGYMDSKSVTKIARMKRYFPSVKLIVIDADQYKEIAKIGKVCGFE